MRWQDDLQFYSMHFMPYVHLPPDQETYDSLWVDFSNKHYDPKKGHELYQRYFREMVLADFAIAEFGSHSQSLEDVFMAVTRGAVQ